MTISPYMKFSSKPSIVETAVTVGPLEAKSPYKDDFDVVYEHERLHEATNEQGQARMVEETCRILCQKAGLLLNEIDLVLAGDLVNQMTPSNFALREFQAPFIGHFSACATSVASLITAASFIEAKLVHSVIAGASSQHNAVERQFRYPVDYGAQKPPTGQWTVTGSGFALVGGNQPTKPHIVSATVGRVIDQQQTDPLDMGTAMAPAAFDTIERHITHRPNNEPYDLLMTGDLGKVGSAILRELLQRNQLIKSFKTIQDGGALFYGNDEKFQAGASGAGCSASMYFGPVYKQLCSGELKSVLLVATGALLSPLSFQQGESIPCIAHAVELRMGESK